MKQIKSLIVFGFLLIIITGCPVVDSSPSSSSSSPTVSYPSDVTADNEYSGGYQVFHVDSKNTDVLHYSLTGLTNSDVYFVITNTSVSNEPARPTITQTSSQIASSDVSASLSMSSVSRSSSIMDTTATKLRSGTNEIDRFTENLDLGPLKSETSTLESSTTGLLASTASVVEGTTKQTFYCEKPWETVEATCQKVVSGIHGKTLYIWVADNSYANSGTSSNKMTSSDVDSIANSFLKAGDDNDIYEWVTNIYGAEWGSHKYANLISNTNEISILLYDIASSGVIGYYFPKDNYKAYDYKDTKAYDDFSNRRLMFYMDVPLYKANAEQSISTLAHEFQHMIHFYQKQVLRSGGVGSKTWLNELCSLMSEDLVAKKLGVPGPRGVDSSTAGPGSANNNSGRLPYFVTNSYLSFIDWSPSYSHAYSYGAFLLRNYGGADVARRILQNSYTDYRAVQAAISDTFATSLQKWGAACILSDLTSPPSGYKYNNGDSWMESTLGSSTYSLGSINMGNYSSGLTIYNSSSDLSFVPDDLDQGANFYYQPGTNLSGDYSWDVKLSHYETLTVVVRPNS